MFGAPVESAPGPAEGTGQAQQPQPQLVPSPQNQGGEQQPYSLADEFLKSVPENQRALVAPHIKGWDAQVTKKFQEIHSQYAPYKELGVELDVLQQAVQIYQALQDPSSTRLIYDALKQEFDGQQQPQPDQFGNQQQQIPNGQQNQDAFELPPVLDERLTRTETLLEQLAQYIVSQHEAGQEQQENKLLDDTLAGLEQKHGKFDVNSVLVNISQGMDPDAAVTAWKNSMQEYMRGNAAPNNAAPVVVSGNGGGYSAPKDEINIGNIPSKEVRDLVAGMLSQVKKE